MSTKISSSTPHAVSEDYFSYKMAYNMTDYFTSCVKTYESLLPYFEEGRPSEDHIYKKLLKIKEIISKLHVELTMLKSVFVSGVYYDSNISEQNISKEEFTEDVNKHDFLQYINNEDKKMVEHIFHGENSVKKSTAEVDTKECSCLEIDFFITSRDQISSIKKQDESTEIKPVVDNKPVVITDTHSENFHENIQEQESKHHMSSSTNERDSSLSQDLFKAEGSSFNLIQPTENGFKCFLCNKQLSGHKVVIDHVKGNGHQRLLASFENIAVCSQESKDGGKKQDSQVNVESSVPHSETKVEKKTVKLRNVLRGVLHIQGSTDLYISHSKGVILCTVCHCEIPSNIRLVGDHLSGRKHLKKKTKTVHAAQ